MEHKVGQIKLNLFYCLCVFNIKHKKVPIIKQVKVYSEARVRLKRNKYKYS